MGLSVPFPGLKSVGHIAEQRYMLVVALFKISVCFRTNFTGLCVTIKSIFFALGNAYLTFEVKGFLFFSPVLFFS